MQHVCHATCLSCNMFVMQHLYHATCLSCNMFIMQHVCHATCLSCDMFVMQHVCHATCLSCDIFVMQHVFHATYLSCSMFVVQHGWHAAWLMWHLLWQVSNPTSGIQVLLQHDEEVVIHKWLVRLKLAADDIVSLMAQDLICLSRRYCKPYSTRSHRS